MREALHQGQKEKAEFHRRSIEKLNARYVKLQNRIDRIYLDKLDGEVEGVFYRKNVSLWWAEQNEIQDRVRRHQKADENFIEQGIRLPEIARNASRFYQSQGQAERATLLGFILSGSTLKDDQVVPAFKQPFDVIRRIAQEARANRQDIKNRHQPIWSKPVQLRSPAVTRTPDLVVNRKPRITRRYQTSAKIAFSACFGRNLCFFGASC
jgi:hypothetical protein